MAAELSRMREVLAEARAELETERRHTQAEVGDVARWLCLVPAWSPTLAQRCGFPGCADGVDESQLEAWRAKGLLEAETSPLTIDDTGKIEPPPTSLMYSGERATPTMAR